MRDYILVVLLCLPFLIQALAMSFDEFYYHRKRKLPLWERIGHPLDTITFLACIWFVILFNPTLDNLFIYLALSLFSCLFITKDEWIHKRENCLAEEQWIHSILFIVHPLVLVSLGLLWFVVKLDYNFFENDKIISFLLELVIYPFVFMTHVFFFYQIIYWNFYYKSH